MLVTAMLFPVINHAEEAKAAVQVTKQATINTYKVNIRKGPATNYPVVTKLVKGQKVPITGSSKSNNKDVW